MANNVHIKSESSPSLADCLRQSAFVCGGFAIAYKFYVNQASEHTVHILTKGDITIKCHPTACEKKLIVAILDKLGVVKQTCPDEKFKIRSKATF